LLNGDANCAGARTKSSLFSTDSFLASVTIGNGSRSFSVGFIGAVTQHYTLTGGIVVPEGTSLTADNSTFSTNAVNVRVLGYFVAGAK
jgi:hypothetical protein